MQPRPDQTILTVSDLNREARELLESGLPGLWVEGEISGFVHHGSGHMYFSLKDDQAQVRCAMFRGANRHLSFRPENGLQVMLQGKVTIYEPRGSYQVVVDQMEPAGEGLLRRRLSDRPDALSLVKQLTGELRRVAQTVTASLDFVRPAALDRAPVAAAALLDDALSMALARLPFEGSLERDYAPELPPLLADEDQLRAVLADLLVNALEALATARERGAGSNARGRCRPPMPSTRSIARGRTCRASSTGSTG